MVAEGVPLVDTHAHVYTLDMPLSGSAWHKPPNEAPVAAYLAELDTHGVRYAVLAATSLYDDYNDYQIEAVRRHRRLRTTVIIPPTTDPLNVTSDPDSETLLPSVAVPV